jgi:hypothetical protein
VRVGVIVFVIGAVVGLVGDACHVVAGVTRYEWEGVPVVWKSAVWFPVVLGGAVVALSWAARHHSSNRGPIDVVGGAFAVLGLYALTAALRGEPEVVQTVLIASLGALVWWWWDASARAALTGAFAAVLGPLGEIAIVEIGAASYAPDVDGLLGVSPMLVGLYFAAGAVASGMWSALERPPSRDGRDRS